MKKTKTKIPKGTFRRSVALFLLLAMLLSVIPAPTVKAADDGVMVTGTGDSGELNSVVADLQNSYKPTPSSGDPSISNNRVFQIYFTTAGVTMQVILRPYKEVYTKAGVYDSILDLVQDFTYTDEDGQEVYSIYNGFALTQHTFLADPMTARIYDVGAESTYNQGKLANNTALDPLNADISTIDATSGQPYKTFDLIIGRSDDFNSGTIHPGYHNCISGAATTETDENGMVTYTLPERTRMEKFLQQIILGSSYGEWDDDDIALDADGNRTHNLQEDRSLYTELLKYLGCPTEYIQNYLDSYNCRLSPESANDQEKLIPTIVWSTVIAESSWMADNAGNYYGYQPITIDNSKELDAKENYIIVDSDATYCCGENTIRHSGTTSPAGNITGQEIQGLTNCLLTTPVYTVGDIIYGSFLANINPTSSSSKLKTAEDAMNLFIDWWRGVDTNGNEGGYKRTTGSNSCQYHYKVYHNYGANGNGCSWRNSCSYACIFMLGSHEIHTGMADPRSYFAYHMVGGVGYVNYINGTIDGSTGKQHYFRGFWSPYGSRDEGSLSIQKDITSEEAYNSTDLEGWKFELYESEADAQAGVNYFNAAYTDLTGKATFEALEAGVTYYVKEAPLERQDVRNALSGWTTDGEIFSAVVVKDDVILVGTAYNTYVPNAPISITKSPSCSTAVYAQIQNNPLYSLAGAEYTVYLNGVKQEVLVTDENGYAKSNKSYPMDSVLTIRETKAPAGFLLDETVYTHTVNATNTNIAVEDAPVFDPSGIVIQKNNSATGSAMGNTSYEGAIFKWEYWEGATNSGDPARTWYFETNERGYHYYNPSYLTDDPAYPSDELYVAESGTCELPLGYLVVTEVVAPTGYALLEPLHATITQDAFSGIAVFDWTEESWDYISNGAGDTYLAEEPVDEDTFGKFTIQKLDYDDDSAILQGEVSSLSAKFEVINRSTNAVKIGDFDTAEPGEVCFEFWTNNDGSYTSEKIFPIGSYEIREAQAPIGMNLNTEWSVDFTVTETAQEFDFSDDPCYDKVIRGGVQIFKVDTLLGNNTDKDAALDGITYSVISLNNNDIIIDDELYGYGEVVTTLSLGWDNSLNRWTAKTSNNLLPYGTYKIVENPMEEGSENANEAYLLSSEEYTFSIRTQGAIVTTNTASAEMVFHNTPMGGITIQKTTNTGTDLAGWVFEVYSASGTLVAELTTDENGVASLDSINPGTYTIKEVGNTNGKWNSPYWSYDVTATNGISINRHNLLRNPELNGKTGWNGTNGTTVTAAERDGKAVLRVDPDTGNYASGYVTQTVNNIPAGTYTFSADVYFETAQQHTASIWNATWQGLQTYYFNAVEGWNHIEFSYTFEEDMSSIIVGVAGKKNTGGFDLYHPKLEMGDTSTEWTPSYSGRTITITGSGAQHNVVNNEYGRIKIQKTTNTGSDLAGWIFEIRDNTNTVVGTVTTDANGYAISDYLAPGSYTVQEVGGANGKWGNDLWVCDTTAKQVQVVGSTDTTVAVSNTVSGSLVITKTFNGESWDEWSWMLNGGAPSFRLWSESLGYDETKTMDSATGQVSFTGLTAGSYKVQEVSCPTYWALITDDSVYDVEIVNGSVAEHIHNNTVGGDIGIFKTSNDGNVEGFEFEIRTTDGEVVYRGFTDENGELLTSLLAPGSYVVEEILPADSFYVCIGENPRTVTVYPDETNEIFFTNYYDAGRISVQKSTNTGEDLEGWIFEVTDSSGTVVATLTTDENGYAESELLRTGTYTVTEVGGNNGCWGNEYWVCDSESKSVTVTSTKTTAVSVHNNHYGALNIRKLTNTGKNLSGWQFRVWNEAGTYDLCHTTGTNGYVKLTGLEPGTYYVQEVGSTDPYWECDITKYTVDVTAGATAIHFATNNHYGKLNIQKTTNTGEDLAGWQFAVINSSGTVVKILTTDDSGYAESGNLTPGSYTVKEIGSTVEGLWNNPYWAYDVSAMGGVYVGRLNIFSTADMSSTNSWSGLNSTTRSLSSVDGVQTILVDPSTSTGTWGYLAQSIYNVPAGTYTMSADIYSEVEQQASSSFWNASWQGIGSTVVTLQPGWNHLERTITFTEEQTRIIAGWGVPKGNTFHVAHAKLELGDTASGWTPSYTGTALVVSAGATTTHNVTNHEYGRIKIQKETNTGEHLEGWVFEVYDASGTVVATLTTDESGYAISDYMTPGTYTIKEVENTNGNWNSPYWSYDVTATDGISINRHNLLRNPELNGKTGWNGTNGTTVTAAERDGKAVLRVDPDTGNYASGYVTQTVNNIPAGTYTFSADVYFETAQQHTAAIWNATWQGLQTYYFNATAGWNHIEFSYTFEEDMSSIIVGVAGKKNTGGFDLYHPKLEMGDTSTEWTPTYAGSSVTVDGSTDTTHTVQNNEYGRIKIRKTTNIGSDLAGWVFEVKDSNGNVVAELTTDSTGYAISDYLTPGSYIVTEVGGLEGKWGNEYWDCDTTSYRVVVTKETDVLHTVQNNHLSGLTIKKITNIDDCSGWTFGVWQVAADGTETFVGKKTIAEGEDSVTFEGLEPGKYRVRELVAESDRPANETGLWICDTEAKDIEIAAGTPAEISFTNTLMCQLSVRKYTSTGKDLEGWVFEIKDSNGTVVDTVTTDNSGYAYSKALPAGTYSIKEVGGTDGKFESKYWDCDSQTAITTIAPGERLNTDFYNAQVAELVIQKRTNTGTNLANWTFRIWNDRGFETVVTTDASGKAVVSKLMPGSYYIQEVVVPGGYIFPDTDVHEIEVVAGATYTYEHTNIFKGRIEIQKSTNTGENLEGWIFEIKDSEGNVVETVITDEDGKAYSDYLLPGNYTITEVGGEGNNWNNPYWAYDVTATGGVYVGRQNLLRNPELNGKTGWNGTNNTTVSAATKEGKAVILVDPSTNKYASGYVTQTVNNIPAGTYTFSADVYFETAQQHTAAIWNATWQSLKTYYFNAVAGWNHIEFSYTFEEDMSSIIVGVGSSKTLDGFYLYHPKLEMGDTASEWTPSYTGTTLTVSAGATTTHNVTNNLYGKIMVDKTVNADGDMAGWIFEIKDSNGTVVDTITTDENGYAYSKMLPPGDYTVEEVGSTDDRWNNAYWVCDSDIEAITVSGGSTAEVSFENIYMGKILIKKLTSNGADYEGWVFEIRDSDGNLVETLTTDDKGSATSSLLMPGIYTVTEVGGADGKWNSPYWVCDTSSHEIEVKAGRLNTVEVENTVYGALHIVKTFNGESWEDWNWVVSNGSVQFRLWSDELGYDETKTVDPDTGTVDFTNLVPSNSYKLQEICSATYWALKCDDNIYDIEIVEETTVEHNHNNTVGGRVVIFKSSTDGVVDGFEFQIRTEDGEVVYQGFTDENGEIASDILSPGTYIVEELLPPDSPYVCLSENPRRVSVCADEDTEVFFENLYDVGYLQISKMTNTGEFVISGTAIALYPTNVEGWEISIYRDKDCTEPIEGSPFVTDSNGSIYLEDLKTGTYYVKETGGVNFGNPAWECDGTVHTVQIKSDRTTNLFIVNELIPAKIIIEKVNSDGNYLAGAKFLFEYSEDGETWNPITFNNTDLLTVGGCANQALVDGTLTTNETGIITVSGLHPLCQYRVTEVEAPEGYVLLTDYAFIGTIPADANNEYTLTLNVVNSHGYALPTTGGETNAAMVAGGMILMLLSILGLAVLVKAPQTARKVCFIESQKMNKNK